jgi:hypothetical protein
MTRTNKLKHVPKMIMNLLLDEDLELYTSAIVARALPEF